MSDQVFEVEFRGKDTNFAATAREATKAIGELKGVGTSLIATFSGGLVGGGIAQTLFAAADRLIDVIREGKKLAEFADQLNVDKGSAQGVRNLENAAGIPVSSAIQSIRRSVADASAGDATSKEAFSRLGLDPGRLADLDNIGKLYRVVDVLEKFDPEGPKAGEQMDAASKILGGRSNAEALIPYMRGGLFREQRLFNSSGNIFAEFLRDPDALQRYKKDFEPVSTARFENESTAKRIKAGNDEEEAKLIRERLPLQQQITEAIKREADLLRQADAAVDPLARERVRSRALAIRGEIETLKDKQASDLAKQVALPGVTFRPGGVTSGATAIGLGAGLASGSARPSLSSGPGGESSAVIALLTAQLTTAKAQLVSLGALPSAIAREL